MGTSAETKSTIYFEVLAKYHVEDGENDVLGEGTLGKVFKAADGELRRHVAVKALQKAYVAGQDETAIKCKKHFANEAIIAANLDHPGIPAIIGLGKHSDGTPFYAMRCINGNTLDAVVDDFFDENTQGHSIKSLLNVFVELCRIVEYAHSRDCLHCDIKPTNIMIGEHSEVILVDWGSAKLAGEGDQPGGVSKGIGSPVFQSPEHFLRHTLTARSDIYCLGTTLYFLVSGKLPFRASSDSQRETSEQDVIRQRVLNGSVRSLADANSTVNPILRSIIYRAIRVKPEERYRCVAEIREDIEAYLNNGKVSAHRYTIGQSIVRGTRVNPYVPLALLGLLVVMLALLGGFAAENARSRRAALESKKHALELASAFAARAVGDRVNTRWQILEYEANHLDLIELLGQANADGGQVPWEELSLALGDIAARNERLAGWPASWFLNNAQGIQVARVPASPFSVGRSYSHRDYFHGKGKDYDEGALIDGPGHILLPHVSIAYVSETDQDYKVAITVPVWKTPTLSPEREFAGVIGMSVRLGEFGELGEQLAEKQTAMVFDMERVRIEDTSYEGLLLHHPQQVTGHPVEVSPTVLASSRATRESISQEIFASVRNARRERQSIQFYEAFPDPVSGDLLSASVAPVMVEGRERAIGDLGWAVVIAEKE